MSFYVYFMNHLVWRVCFYWSVYDPQRDIFACMHIHLYICVFVITQKMFEMNLSNILNNGFLSIGSQFTTYNCTAVRNMLWNPFRTTIVSVDLTLLLCICMYAYSCIYMSRRDHTSTTNDIYRWKKPQSSGVFESNTSGLFVAVLTQMSKNSSWDDDLVTENSNFSSRDSTDHSQSYSFLKIDRSSKPQRTYEHDVAKLGKLGTYVCIHVVVY